MLKTEHEFTLPKGYVDADGNLHREVVMRLATGADEILPLEDVRVKNNPAYLLVILMSRVIVKLGSLTQEAITPKVIEGLFAQDLNSLQTFYNQINGNGHICTSAECPQCHHTFDIEIDPLGES
jgi:hypothetical protein